MNLLGAINIVAVSLAAIITIVCCIGIIIASRFQSKQKKKLDECINIIKEKGIETLQFKNGMTEEEINDIDDTIDVNDLMKELYDKYLNFENKIKNFDDNLDELLTGFIKDFYINKINNFKEKGYEDITDGIDLIGYTITEFDKKKLKFKITINCFDYKKVNNVIVSGSNLEKVEQVIILTYEKIKDKWLISNYEKVYEKKISV